MTVFNDPIGEGGMNEQAQRARELFERMMRGQTGGGMRGRPGDMPAMPQAILGRPDEILPGMSAEKFAGLMYGAMLLGPAFIEVVERAQRGQDADDADDASGDEPGDRA